MEEKNVSNQEVGAEEENTKEEKIEQSKEDEAGNNMALGMCFGVAFGVIFGPILFDSIGTGIAICLPLGMLIGIGIMKGKK